MIGHALKRPKSGLSGLSTTNTNQKITAGKQENYQNPVCSVFFFYQNQIKMHGTCLKHASTAYFYAVVLCNQISPTIWVFLYTSKSMSFFLLKSKSACLGVILVLSKPFDFPIALQAICFSYSSCL